MRKAQVGAEDQEAGQIGQKDIFPVGVEPTIVVKQRLPHKHEAVPLGHRKIYLALELYQSKWSRIRR